MDMEFMSYKWTHADYVAIKVMDTYKIKNVSYITLKNKTKKNQNSVHIFIYQ